MGASRFIPAHAIDRPRLRQELDAALGSSLTVMVAGAGSGKSVLLTQWAQSHPEVPIVWIEVGDRDREPGRFVGHLLQELDSAVVGISALASSDTLARLGIDDTVVGALADGLLDVGELVLIFDDLHHVSPTLDSDLARVVNALPANVHVILSSRVDLPGVRYRAHLRGDVQEIRRAQLAFDLPQTAELLRRVTQLELDEADVRALQSRTEGWVAGLLLAAVTMRRHPDPAAFVSEFSGSDRLVADYLSEEVLQTLNEDDRRELLEMSALDRMSVSLVTHIAATPPPQQLFVRMERELQFLIPLDDRREWYRFHHLFRDMLRVWLRAEDPGAERRVLTAAAEWHRRRGELGTAVDYLLRANEWERASEVILAHGSSVFERGSMRSVIRWIEAIPESVRTGNVDLLLLYGILTGMVGLDTQSEDLLREAAGHADATVGHVAVAHSFLAALVQWRPRPIASLDCARRALDALEQLGGGPTPDLLRLTDARSLESVALVSGGRANFLAGDVVEARSWLERGLAGEGTLYSVWRTHTLGALALLDAWEGQTMRAAELAGEALAVAEQTGTFAHPATADALLANALVAAERSGFETAAHELWQATVRIAVDHRIQLAWVSYAIGARIAAARGEEHAEARPAGSPPPLVADALAVLRARRLRLAGDADNARHVLAERSASSEVLVELCWADLALGRLDEARDILRLLEQRPNVRAPLLHTRTLLLAASVSSSDAPNARSDALLCRALRLADRYGLVSVFAEASAETVSRIAALGPAALPPIAATVLGQVAAVTRIPVDSAVVESFTERELELLVLLPTRYTNHELARHFYVSVNTIKSHLAHIYRKLDVSTRSGAIRRATELGLLSQPGILEATSLQSRSGSLR